MTWVAHTGSARSQETDVLLEKRYISMALFYRDDPAKPQKPKGFVTGTTDVFYFANADGWEKRTKVLNDLHSGFHQYILK